MKKHDEDKCTAATEDGRPTDLCDDCRAYAMENA